jgi:glycosyltransferase involved in cell wall biosynthesis
MNNISAVIPVYNGESFIEDAILSLIEQIAPNNIIIVDDGSLDDSVNLVKKFGKVKIIENSFRSGVSAAINLGVNSVETNYFIIQGSDDISSPNRVKLQENYLSQTGATCVIGAPKTINDEGLEIITDVFHEVSPKHQINFVELFSNENYLCAPAASFNTKKYLDMGGFHEYLLLLQDFKLWLDLSIKDEIKYLPECVVNYRLHQNNLSNIYLGSHKNRMLAETEGVYRSFMNMFCLDIKLAQKTFSQNFNSRDDIYLYLLKLYLNHPNYFVRVLGFKIVLEANMIEELKEDLKRLCDFLPIDYISNSGTQFPDI